MKAPTPNKKTFPPSWRKWRKLKVGEKFREGDRVILTWRFRKDGSTEEKLHSVQMGKNHIGHAVNPAGAGIEYAYGWYYRKVS